MSETTIALLAGFIGFLLGISGLIAVRVSQRRRHFLADVQEPTLPEGTAEILAALGLAYVVVDGVDGVVRASPAAYAYGIVRGHTVVHQELLDMVRATRRNGVVEERRLELTRGQLQRGSIVLDVRVVTIADEYILLLADDQTEIVRAQSIRNDFVANVSHELKTPVGAVSLLSEAIEDAAGDEESVRHFAASLQRESMRLSALVQDIIELSRLQGTDVVAKGTPVDLNRTVGEAVDRSRLAAETKHIEIRVGGRIDVPVFGDPDMLVTAVRNLIDNAVRYSPEHTRVGVGLRERDGMAQITVTDQGPGIPESEQDRVFERFYRVDSARSRQTGGTGLGLSIVKHVMAQHGGEVSVWSQPGRGSTFTLVLPPMEDPEDQHEPPRSSGGNRQQRVEERA
ncbi:two-component system, OmpR family, sensor histidine kinase SenX3 [Kocuria rhizophila]|uniref:Sensor-like histidine kinase SenX3 n=1 Tax=Kocuria rhizophila (strain ATCC 9341 / DSM 348 / NBRC 103217 / DC2201) TaxID=378753 RepID=B2GFT4_KOCRD|nr:MULTISPECIES: ATP-binding protein [Kocuria]HAG63005.1 two-component sensor histidine kinase [Kocuria sp.]ASE12015.1 two-component sensor histidine kinase [Kocuria rhizophila]MBK4121357.1 two-component sensor histidine kinase [Kocuria rhizophila]MCC5673564.1 two-component sensor histidine kinase [Kocuria rhizophila]MDV5999774.1 two-component sensor histidine kinase [Kocuria rhizophila]